MSLSHEDSLPANNHKPYNMGTLCDFFYNINTIYVSPVFTSNRKRRLWSVRRRCISNLLLDVYVWFIVLLLASPSSPASLRHSRHLVPRSNIKSPHIFHSPTVLEHSFPHTLIQYYSPDNRHSLNSSLLIGLLRAPQSPVPKSTTLSSSTRPSPSFPHFKSTSSVPQGSTLPSSPSSRLPSRSSSSSSVNISSLPPTAHYTAFPTSFPAHTATHPRAQLTRTHHKLHHPKTQFHSQGRNNQRLQQIAMENSEHQPDGEVVSRNGDVVGRSRRATSAPQDDEGNWMVPCPQLYVAAHEQSDPPHKLAYNILKALVFARSHVDRFIKNFSKQVLSRNTWEESLEKINGRDLPFLNNTSAVNFSDHSSFSFELALLEAYELMQRRAVGIEQVTLDQALYQASFLSDFRHMEERVVHILCELRYAMLHSNVKPRDDITKDIMQKSRDIHGEAERNIRDAVILREYIRGLDDLYNLFQYFSKKDSTAPAPVAQ